MYRYFINGHIILLLYNLYYGCHMAYSCNCTCISRHGLVISMKIIIVRTRGFDKMDQIPYSRKY